MQSAECRTKNRRTSLFVLHFAFCALHFLCISPKFSYTQGLLEGFDFGILLRCHSFMLFERTDFLCR